MLTENKTHFHSYFSWIKNPKSLIQLLLISVTLNITFLFTLIYFAFRDAAAPISEELTTFSSTPPFVISERMQTLLGKYQSFSFEELLEILQEKEHVESGYTKRDLSLACLVSFHDFNLTKALGTKPISQREIKTEKGVSLFLFPDLTEEQFAAISNYAQVEKWPFSSKGLFRKIQESKFPYDTSLLEAFYLTPEYYFISLLFFKTGLPLKKEYIASLIAQSSWEKVTTWAETLKHTLDFSIHKRREWLLLLMTDYRSRLAAKIFAEADTDYCLSFFNNEQILSLCALLKEKMPSKLLTLLLESPRSTTVWEVAARLLYEQSEESPPSQATGEEFLKIAKTRFISKKEETLSSPPLKTPSSSGFSQKKHVIGKGENLWKIAQKYGVSIPSLKELNHLSSDRLRVGDELLIPSSS